MSALGAVVSAFVVTFGLFVGSFLNVVIYRLPRECLSVWRQTRSRCPRCSLQLSWYDNIPLLSYFVLLRGRCRNCRVPISRRYPLIESATALVIAFLVWRVRGWDGIDHPFDEPESWLVALVYVLVAASLIALSVIDLDYRILPDAMTLPGIALAPLVSFAVPRAMPSPVWEPFGEGAVGMALRWTALLNGLAGAALAAALLWSIGWAGSKAFKKPAMGLGDVKLYAAMGGLLGFWVLLVLPLASLLGSVVGLAALAVRRDHYLPFGPFLAIGMMMTWLDGPQLFGSILNALGHGGPGG